MKHKALTKLFILIAALCATMPCAAQESADAIYLNGDVYTVDDQRSRARAVAVRDGRFLAVGSNNDIQALGGADTEVKDLQGRMVPTANPWPGMEAMVTRSDPYTDAPDRLWAEQAIDLATAIEIFTRNGAAALRREGSSGSIETGKVADFIVLDRNLFEIDPRSIGDTRAMATFFAGRKGGRRR